MTVDLVTLLKVAPFPEEQRQRLLANLDRLTDDQKLRLSETAWTALTGMYAARLKYERDKLLLEIAQGKRGFDRRDLEQIEEKANQAFVQALKAKSASATEESTKEVIEELKERLLRSGWR